METDFGQLIELQKKDIEIDEVVAELEELPGQVDELKNDLEGKKASCDVYRKAVKQSGLQHKEHESQLQQKEQEITKFNNELNAIKTNEAYKAMLTQIERAKQEQSQLEDQILEYLEKSDQFKKDLKSSEEKFKQEESDINAEIGEKQKRIQFLEEDLKRREADRHEFIQKVPGWIRSQYEHIRKGKGGLALVMIKGNACSGCNYSLPPQKINEAAKGRDVVICENCSRIIYVDPALQKTGE